MFSSRQNLTCEKNQKIMPNLSLFQILKNLTVLQTFIRGFGHSREIYGFKTYKIDY